MSVFSQLFTKVLKSTLQHLLVYFIDEGQMEQMKTYEKVREIRCLYESSDSRPIRKNCFPINLGGKKWPFLFVSKVVSVGEESTLADFSQGQAKVDN